MTPVEALRDAKARVVRALDAVDDNELNLAGMILSDLERELAETLAALGTERSA